MFKIQRFLFSCMQMVVRESKATVCAHESNLLLPQDDVDKRWKHCVD